MIVISPIVVHHHHRWINLDLKVLCICKDKATGPAPGHSAVELRVPLELSFPLMLARYQLNVTYL